MHFFGELGTDSFGRRDLFDSRFPQPIHRTKFPKEQILPVLAYAWAIIENAFVDSLLEQKLMVRIREPVRFIADPLE
jgi:hypothetical protein